MPVTPFSRRHRPRLQGRLSEALFLHGVRGNSCRDRRQDEANHGETLHQMKISRKEVCDLLGPKIRSARSMATSSLLAGAATLLWAVPCLANAGLPMLVLAWPASWIAFLPIVLVEAHIARRLLAVSFRRGIRLALVANAWSTLVGIPFTWFALLLLEVLLLGVVFRNATPNRVAEILLAPLGAPWITATARWQIPAAGACLCLPFLVVSTWIEGAVARRSFPPDLSRRWARSANLVTYVPIAVGLAAYALALAFTSLGAVDYDVGP